MPYEMSQLANVYSQPDVPIGNISLPNTSDLAFFKRFGSENRFVVNDEKHLATVFAKSILKLN